MCDELNIQLPFDLDMSRFHVMFLKLTSNGPLDCKLCMPRVRIMAQKYERSPRYSIVHLLWAVTPRRVKKSSDGI